MRPSGAPPIALIADDDEDIREVLSMAVGSAGLGAVLAEDGRQAVQLLENLHPDIILLDVQMPGLSGIEVCWWIRRQRHLAHVPVVLVSARTSPFEIDAGLLAGANHYVTKPFTQAEILAVVARFRRGRPSTHRALRAPAAVVIPDLGLVR
ncbi:MAG: response regulator [Pedococcus sp.]